MPSIDMTPVAIKDLNIGDILRIIPNDPKAYKIVEGFASEGVDVNFSDDLIYVGGSVMNNETILVSFRGKVSGGWLPKRFYMAVQCTTEDRLLRKIDSLWKRQLWYKEHYAQA